MKKFLAFPVLLALMAGAFFQPISVAQEQTPTPTPTPKPCEGGVRGKLCFNYLPGEVAIIKLRWLSIDDNPTWTEWTQGDATPSYGRYDGGSVCVDASMDWLSYQRLEWQGLDAQGRVIVSGQMPLPKGWKGPECEPKIQWDLVVNLPPYGPMPAATYTFPPASTWMVPQPYAMLTSEASGYLWFGPTYEDGFGTFSAFGSGNLMGNVNDSYQSVWRVVMQNPYAGQIVEGAFKVGSADNQFAASYTGLLEFVSGSAPNGLTTIKFTNSGHITSASGAYAYLLGASFDLNGYGLVGYPIPVYGQVRLSPAH